MTKELKLPGDRPEALSDPSHGRLVEAVKEWVDEAGGADPQDLLRELNKTVIEQVLEVELDHHLGYVKHDPAGDGSGNNRNGTRSKTLKTIVGEVTIDVPRDRAGTFQPVAVRPYQRRLSGFDDMVVSLYGKGLTTGEIRSHLEEIYDSSVSAELISEITDRVLAEFTTWQNRPLAEVWPVVVIDAIWSAAQREWWSSQDGTQAGDPDKLSAAVLAIAEKDPPPRRFIAGADVVALAQRKIHELKDDIDSHRKLSESLTYDE